MSTTGIVVLVLVVGAVPLIAIIIVVILVVVLVLLLPIIIVLLRKLKIIMLIIVVVIRVLTFTILPDIVQCIRLRVKALPRTLLLLLRWRLSFLLRSRWLQRIKF